MFEAQLSPSHTIEVLGVTLGSGPRQRSSKEIQRAKHVSQISARLQVLPCTQKFKAMLAATVPQLRRGDQFSMGGHLLRRNNLSFSLNFPLLSMELKRSATHLPTSNKFWFWDIALICSSTRCKNF